MASAKVDESKELRGRYLCLNPIGDIGYILSIIVFNIHQIMHLLDLSQIYLLWPQSNIDGMTMQIIYEIIASIFRLLGSNLKLQLAIAKINIRAEQSLKLFLLAAFPMNPDNMMGYRMLCNREIVHILSSEIIIHHALNKNV